MPPRLLRVAIALAGSLCAATGLMACGQKGALRIPHDPAAAQRATLPQTIFGGSATSRAQAASQPAPSAPPPLPDLPDIQ